MPAFNFTESIQQVAESVKQKTQCPRHGAAPGYTLIKTMRGFNVQWSYCCDIQKQEVERRFAEESSHHPEAI